MSWRYSGPVVPTTTSGSQQPESLEEKGVAIFPHTLLSHPKTK